MTRDRTSCGRARWATGSRSTTPARSRAPCAVGVALARVDDRVRDAEEVDELLPAVPGRHGGDRRVGEERHRCRRRAGTAGPTAGRGPAADSPCAERRRRPPPRRPRGPAAPAARRARGPPPRGARGPGRGAGRAGGRHGRDGRRAGLEPAGRVGRPPTRAPGGSGARAGRLAAQRPARLRPPLRGAPSRWWGARGAGRGRTARGRARTSCCTHVVRSSWGQRAGAQTRGTPYSARCTSSAGKPSRRRARTSSGTASRRFSATDSW